MQYEIVKYQPEFKSQVLKLQTHLWSSNISLNNAYFEWKYNQNPYFDTPLIYLALYKGKVVGTRGMYGTKWELGQPTQHFLIPCAGDLVIAPEHRDRGLFTKIMEVAISDLAHRREYTYAFNLSASPTTFLGSRLMGWRNIGFLQRMIRQKSPSNVIQRYLNKLSFFSSVIALFPFWYLDRRFVRQQNRLNKYISVEKSLRPEAMAELVERIGGDGRIRHVRDQQYFAWRFQNPLSQYRFVFWEDTRLEGYLVLQTDPRYQRQKVNIVDWEASNTQIRSELLQAAIDRGNFKRLYIWLTTLPDEAKIILQNAGFRLMNVPGGVTHYRPTVLVRPVHDEMIKADWVLAEQRLLDVNNWDLRMIYSDGF